MRSWAPAGARRLSGKAVARHRWDDDVERVFGLPAVCGWIGQRSDELDLLENRARPTVRDNHRKRIGVFRTNVDEVNVQPVDRRHELRQGVQPSFDLTPIVICPPVAREFLNRRELHALRCIRYRFLLRPFRRSDASAEIDKLLVRNVEAEGTDFFTCCYVCHCSSPVGQAKTERHVPRVIRHHYARSISCARWMWLCETARRDADNRTGRREPPMIVSGYVYLRRNVRAKRERAARMSRAARVLRSHGVRRVTSRGGKLRCAEARRVAYRDVDQSYTSHRLS